MMIALMTLNRALPFALVWLGARFKAFARLRPWSCCCITSAFDDPLGDQLSTPVS
jgi:hypothetical protein